MESILKSVIQEIVASRSLTLKSQDIKPLNFGESSYFVSGVYRITLTIENEGREKILHLLAKLTDDDSPAAGFVHMHLLFNNEYMFYEKYVNLALPTLKQSIPEYFYGNIEKRGNECLVIEFLKDYNMCQGNMFIPNNHVELAVREFGKFHGIGYIAEANHPEEFKELCGSLTEARCGREAHKTETFYDRFNVFIGALAIRAFEHIPGKENYQKNVLDKYKAKFQVRNVYFYHA